MLLGSQEGICARTLSGSALGSAIRMPPSTMSVTRMRIQAETCSIDDQLLSALASTGWLLARTSVSVRLQHLHLHIVGDLDQDFRIVLLRHLGHPAHDARRRHHRVAAAQIVDRLAQLLGAAAVADAREGSRRSRRSAISMGIGEVRRSASEVRTCSWRQAH